MGLFSSSTKTSVATSVSRVIEDNRIPDSVKTGALKGLFDGTDQLIENIMEEAVGSIGLKAERMYSYGKNGYLYGLPKATFYHDASGDEAIQAYLQTTTTFPITVMYSKYGAPNNLHFGWTKLYSEYGYNQISNELTGLSAIKGTPVYLVDMEIVVKDATLEEYDNKSLEQWGDSPKDGYTPMRPIQLVRQGSFATGLSMSLIKRAASPIIIEPTAESDYLKVTYNWRDPVTQLVLQETLAIPFVGLDPTKSYFQAKYIYSPVVTSEWLWNEGNPIMVYTTDHTQNVITYFTYEEGSGTIPELDAVYSTEYDDAGSFFPLVYFRLNKQAFATNTTSTEFTSSKKLLKYLNIDYAQSRDAINENPDIDDVDSAFMMMAVPATSTNAVEARYLFDFFKGIYLAVGGGGGAPNPYTTSMVSRSLAARLQAAITLQDARFKMSLNHQGISHKILVGSIAAIGEYVSGTATEAYSVEVMGAESQEGLGDGVLQTVTKQRPYFFYRKQLNASMYEEMRVANLSMKYHIDGDYTDIGYAGDPILLVPIDHSVTEHYPISVREELYARSLHYVFNAKIETKVSWYQSSWFQFVITVIAVVVVAYTGQTELISLANAVALGAMTIAEVAIYVATTVLMNLVYSLAFKLFVKQVGVDAAILLAVVAAAYGAYTGFKAGGIAKAPWAKELLQAASGLMGGVQGSIKDSFTDLLAEANSFKTFMEEQTKLLDDVANLLDNFNPLTPFVIFGEKPDAFYARTIHSGNVGILAIDAVHDYVDMSLRLPTIDQTLDPNFNNLT